MRAWTIALLIAALVVAAPAPRVAAKDCPATAADALGPFYVEGAPERARTGDGLAVEGQVRSTADCRPLAGARIEWWSANASGAYDDAHRASQVTDGEGRYRYVTDMPGKYPGRPVHLHVKITAPGHKTLVTQLYPKTGQRAITFDFVLPPA